MAGSYVPRPGDVVWLEFNPQSGHEQAGHRPVVVLSPQSYNKATSLVLCCPMTTQIKGYPFEVVICATPPSAVLADQVKSLDWVARKAKPKGAVTASELSETRAKALALVGHPLS